MATVPRMANIYMSEKKCLKEKTAEYKTNTNTGLKTNTNTPG